MLKTTINKCTYSLTGNTPQPQYYKYCFDCFHADNEGACLSCIEICHNGHRVSELRHSNKFYCDCGAKGCALIQLTPRLPWSDDITPTRTFPSYPICPPRAQSSNGSFALCNTRDTMLTSDNAGDAFTWNELVEKAGQ